MSNIEKKEKNLNLLIDKLNSLSLSYSQQNYEIEKVRTEKNELLRQKNEIEKKNQELLREHKYLKEKIKDLKLSMSAGSGLITWLSILFLAGFTPLPYKLFTIASGLIGFNLLIFIIVSLISRSLRFFIIAYLSYKFGDLFTEFMNKHGSKWFTALGVLLVLIFIIIFLVIKFNA